MKERIASLERADKTASERRKLRNKRISKQRVLTKGAGENVLVQSEAD
jgi:hypothetical protein